MTPLVKNVLFGGVTGALFKCTLGITPTIVGGVLGATLIGGITLAV